VGVNKLTTVRALHVIPSVSTKRGGPSKAVLELVRELRNYEVEGYVITTTDNGRYQEMKSSDNKWIAHDDIPIMVFPCINSRFRFLREYLVSPSLVLWLLRNATKYDIIHFHAIFSFTTTVGMLVARWKRIPYIVRTIGQLNEWSLHQGRLKKRVMLKLIENSNLENALCIHVTSEIERQDIVKAKLKNDTLMLRLGVNSNKDMIRGKDCSKEDKYKTNFLFLSRIHPKKRLELLIESLAGLEGTSRQWFLDVAGEGEKKYLDNLQDYAVRLGVDDKIRWHGHVTGMTKEKLLSKSDWFVLPSSSENFGIAALEAMASGLPVIVSSEVGIAPYVLEFSTGYVCNTNNKAEFRNILAKCISSDNYNMRVNAINLVKENFLWGVIAKELSGYYQSSIMNSHR
jgi:glycosyltransferase involved in cell wall biosynthesis